MKDDFKKFRYTQFVVTLTSVVILLITLIIHSNSQPVSKPKIRKMYGIADSEFFIMATHALRYHRFVADSVWGFFNSIGVSSFLHPLHKDWNKPEHLDSLYNSPQRQAGYNRLFVYDLEEPFRTVGSGREVIFYADTIVQNPDWICKFKDKAGGESKLNNSGWDTTINGKIQYSPKEMHYSTRTTTTNQQILGDAIMNLDPSTGTPVDSNRNWQILYDFPNGGRAQTYRYYWLAVKARIPENDTSISNNTNIFRVEVYHKVKAGLKYNNGANIVIANQDSSFLIESYFIKKSELLDINFPERYQISEHKLDLQVRSDGHEGPLNIKQPVYSISGDGKLYPTKDSGGSLQLDIKVYWLGGGEVALRSIAIRDTTAQMLLGKDTTARHDLISKARSILFKNGTLRKDIIGLYGSEKLTPTEASGFPMYNYLLKKTFNFGSSEGDSIGILISNYWGERGKDEIQSRLIKDILQKKLNKVW